MDQKNSVSKSLPVPKGRISRASSFGKLAVKFASSVFFVAKIFDIEKLFLYDNSLLEWSNDPTCPMELDQK